MEASFLGLCEGYEEIIRNRRIINELAKPPLKELYSYALINFKENEDKLLGGVYFEEWGDGKVGILYKGLVLGFIKDNGDPSERHVSWPSYMRIPTPEYPQGNASPCSRVMQTNEREQALILAMDRVKGLIEKSLEYKHAR